MKLARLIRIEKTQDGILGTLVIDDRFQCLTMERDDTFLKQGQYHCQRFHGAKYADTFEICVPGHTAVLFHPGNTEDDSQGCVLTGQKVGYVSGKRAVLESKVAFEQFMARMGDDQCFKLFIEDRFL